MSFIQPVRFFYDDGATPPAGAPPPDATPPVTPPATPDAPPATPPPAESTPPPVAVPESTPAPEARFNWQEEIKKVDRKELLKTAGVNDFMIEALDYYEKTGDLTPYLEVKTVDFTKMGDEQVLKYELRKQFRDLSEEDFDLLFQDEMKEKYRLDRELYPENSSSAKAGLVKMRADAARMRNENVQRQAAFKAPERTPDASIVEQQRKQQLEIQNYNEGVQKSETTTSLIQNKKVVLGEGEEAYSFEVKDPTLLVKAATAGDNSLMRAFWDDKGNVNLENFYAVTNYAFNRKAVEKALIEHGKTLGKAEAFKERSNAAPPDATPPPPASGTIDPAAALAKGGKLRPFSRSAVQPN